MFAYEFLPETYARAAVEGQLKISLLQYFQTIEKNEVRDELEGIVSGHVSEGRIGKGGSPDLARRLGRAVVAEGGATLGLKDITVQFSQPPIYILSLTTDPYCKKWLDGPEPYDAMVSINHVRLMALEVARSHPDKLGRWIVRRVAYTKKLADILTEDISPNDPFEKPPHFADEQELRICFEAVEKEPAPYFISNCPQIRPYLSWTPRLVGVTPRGPILLQKSETL